MNLFGQIEPKPPPKVPVVSKSILPQINPNLPVDRNFFHRKHHRCVTKKSLPNRVSQSQESLDLLHVNHDYVRHRNSDMGLNMLVKNNLTDSCKCSTRPNRMSLSRSEDSLNNLKVREFGKYLNK